MTVYQRKALGGKAPSIPVPNSGTRSLPAEHGFRFFPGFYRNVTETMNGLMFYLNKHVDVTKGHVKYVDSGWAITSISEEQFWKKSLAEYGDGTVKECM